VGPPTNQTSQEDHLNQARSRWYLANPLRRDKIHFRLSLPSNFPQPAVLGKDECDSEEVDVATSNEEGVGRRRGVDASDHRCLYFSQSVSACFRIISDNF